jgi:hypothetical protein
MVKLGNITHKFARIAQMLPGIPILLTPCNGEIENVLNLRHIFGSNEWGWKEIKNKVLAAYCQTNQNGTARHSLYKTTKAYLRVCISVNIQRAFILKVKAIHALTINYPGVGDIPI